VVVHRASPPIFAFLNFPAQCGGVLFEPKNKFSEHLFSTRTKKGAGHVIVALEILWEVEQIPLPGCKVGNRELSVDSIAVPLLSSDFATAVKTSSTLDKFLNS